MEEKKELWWHVSNERRQHVWHILQIFIENSQSPNGKERGGWEVEGFPLKL